MGRTCSFIVLTRDPHIGCLTRRLLMSISRRFARRLRTVAHQEKKGWDLPSFKRIFSPHRFARLCFCQHQRGRRARRVLRNSEQGVRQQSTFCFILFTIYGSRFTKWDGKLRDVISRAGA